MAASYPGTIKTFTTKTAGDAIASSHINDLQAEVVAIETQLGVNAFTWNSWTPTETGWASGFTAIARYCKINKLCFFDVYITGTSDNATTSISLPFTSANITGINWSGAIATIKDAGTIATAPGRWAIAANATDLVFLKDMASGAFTATGDKLIRAQGFYEVA